MTKIFALLLLCSSCVHYNVYRIGRHEKIIEVSDTTTKNKHRMAMMAKRKADLLGCDKLEYLEINDTSARCLCTYTP
jgi:hypothetical protein